MEPRQGRNAEIIDAGTTTVPMEDEQSEVMTEGHGEVMTEGHGEVINEGHSEVITKGHSEVPSVMMMLLSSSCTRYVAGHHQPP